MNSKQSIGGIQACVFDAYGTLFDVHSAVGRHGHRLGKIAGQVSSVWRTKQLEYTWLRSLMHHHADFWQVTQDALDFSFAMHGLEDPQLAKDLMNAYLHLECYPEVPEALATLRTRGFKTAILSNGTPAMLKAVVTSAGLETLIDRIFSVEEVGVFKPHPQVYQMAVDGLAVEPEAIIFQSSNAWDAFGASAFGFRVAWINRFGQMEEQLPGHPELQLRDLGELPELLEGG